MYNFFWTKLYNVAYNYTRDKMTAQEIVQDVFIKLWLKRDSLHEIQDMEAYLFKCLKYKVYDEFDKLASRERLNLKATRNFNEATNAVEETIEYEDTLHIINAELDKMPVTTRTIFKLSKFDRYSNEEIAEQMHVSSKAVEYHMTQALKKLRLRLNNLTFSVGAFLLFF